MSCIQLRYSLAYLKDQLEVGLAIAGLLLAYSDKMLFLDLGPGTSDLGSLI